MAGCWINLQFLVSSFFILQSGRTIDDYKNVAFKKPTDQSSLYTDKRYPYYGVDGKEYSCFLTNFNEPSSWWRVNLLHQYYIDEVILHFSNREWMRNNVQIYIDINKTCGDLIIGKKDGSDIPREVNRTCDVIGSSVTVYQAANVSNASPGTYPSMALEVCEVIVKGCEVGVQYGSDCDKFCKDRHCSNTSSVCDVHTGVCDVGGCQPGWSGVDCTDIDHCHAQSTCDVNANCLNTAGSYRCICPSGFSGNGTVCSDVNECLTQNPCDRHANCNNTVGSYTCTCRSGFAGNGYSCKECSSGKYGESCSQECADRHCYGSRKCDVEIGRCIDGCIGGWQGISCLDECSSGKYGESCSQECSDRHCYGSRKCDVETGRCIDGCIAGWQGISCIDECSAGNYGLNCDFTCGNCKHANSCDTVSGQCLGGCTEGFYGALCKQYNSSTAEKTLDPVTIVWASTVGILLLLLIISTIIIIRLYQVNRSKQRESAVKFSEIKHTDEHLAMPSSTSRPASESNKTEISPPVPQPTTKHHYLKSSPSLQNDLQLNNTYEKLNTNAISQPSPYDKIK